MPLSARTNRACVAPIGVHSQIIAGASPIGLDKVGPATPKNTRSTTLEGGGLKPPDPLQMESRASLQCHLKNVPHTGSLTTCPASPIATATEQDEVLGLAVAHNAHNALFSIQGLEQSPAFNAECKVSRMHSMLNAIQCIACWLHSMLNASNARCYRPHACHRPQLDCQQRARNGGKQAKKVTCEAYMSL